MMQKQIDGEASEDEGVHSDRMHVPPQRGVKVRRLFSAVVAGGFWPRLVILQTKHHLRLLYVIGRFCEAWFEVSVEWNA